jgi:hypothetical protein
MKTHCRLLILFATAAFGLLDGKSDGIWVYRDSTGRIVKNVHWHLGKAISTEKFD